MIKHLLQIALTLMLAVILCACANNDASQLGSTPSAEAEASEKELDAKLDEIFKGAVPQNYTYKDDTLTWTYSDEDGEHVSTFVKLTADERTAYEALGIGSKE